MTTFETVAQIVNAAQIFDHDGYTNVNRDSSKHYNDSKPKDKESRNPGSGNNNNNANKAARTDQPKKKKYCERHGESGHTTAECKVLQKEAADAKAGSVKIKIEGAAAKPKDKTDKSKVTCFRCGNTGHYATNCPTRNTASRSVNIAEGEGDSAEIDETDYLQYFNDIMSACLLYTSPSPRD